MRCFGKFVAKGITSGHAISIRFTHSMLWYIQEGLEAVKLDLEMYLRDCPVQWSSLTWLLENDSSTYRWREATRDY
jgi:hypothetical protein